jgi:hypothetical protein
MIVSLDSLSCMETLPSLLTFSVMSGNFLCGGDGRIRSYGWVQTPAGGSILKCLG